MVESIDWQPRQRLYERRRLEWALAYWRALTPDEIERAHSHGKLIPEAIAEIEQQIIEKREAL